MVDRNESSKDRNRNWLYIGALLLTAASKFKVIIPLLSKLAVPVFSMLASIFAYMWLTKSWGTAIGLVAMILIHEAGHVLAAKRRGLPVTLPVFIPFLGALIMMKKHPRDAETEAYIAIGGPVLGTIGALAAYVLGMVIDSVLLVIVAYFGFFINLINLLPIHPLDGGRIATSISRWLWLVGLIGGLYVIYLLKSLLFFIIWAMFAWELYMKYVSKRNVKPVTIPFQIQVPADYLRLNGMFVPGELHQRELLFATYSDLDGKQSVELYWDTLGVREKVSLQNQFIISSAKVESVKHVRAESGELTHIVAMCELKGNPHTNDRYYDVSNKARWQFGVSYVGLAVFLIYMVMHIQSMIILGE